VVDLLAISAAVGASVGNDLFAIFRILSVPFPFLGLRGIEWVILEVENPTKLGIAKRFCILAKPGIRHE
jgi:hypothetical protein